MPVDDPLSWYLPIDLDRPSLVAVHDAFAARQQLRQTQREQQRSADAQVFQALSAALADKCTRREIAAAMGVPLNTARAWTRDLRSPVARTPRSRRKPADPTAADAASPADSEEEF